MGIERYDKYGLQKGGVVDRRHLVRDIRTPLQKTSDFIHNEGFIVLTLLSFVTSLFIPLLNYFNFLVLTPILLYRWKKPVRFPLYCPRSSGFLDANQVNPKTDKPDIAAGDFYLGFDPVQKRQVWTTTDVMKQHLFYAATTGGGKTESIIGFIINFLLMASAALLIDGKGAMDVSYKIFNCFYRFLRVNDFLFINYIRGGLRQWEASELMISNRFNQFRESSESSISELMKSLLDGDGDIWGKRADDYVGAATRPCAFLRDKGELEFSIGTYADLMVLENVGMMVGGIDYRTGKPFNTPIGKDQINALANFVRTLPGMDAASYELIKAGKPLKNTQIYDQFGFITMQIVPVLNMLKGDYGHIFDCKYGHVNMLDVLSSRRGLVIPVPTLEKSSSAMKSLGQMVITAAKDMMSMGIGYEFEGNTRELIEKRFSNSYSPYGSVFDEAAYYAVQYAMAPIFAQARSIGFSAIIALQDLNAVKIVDDKIFYEIKTTASNAITKIGGRIEDTEETIQLFIRRAGKHSVSKMKSVEIDYTGNFVSKYENSNAVEEEDVLKTEMFTSMMPGDAIIIHREFIVNCKMFAVFPPTLTGQRLNEFYPIPQLPEMEKSRLVAHSNIGIKLAKVINDALPPPSDIPSKDIEEIASSIKCDETSTPSQIWFDTLKSVEKHRDERKKLLSTLLDWNSSDSEAEQGKVEDKRVVMNNQPQTHDLGDIFADEDPVDGIPVATHSESGVVLKNKTFEAINNQRQKTTQLWGALLEQTGVLDDTFMQQMTDIEMKTGELLDSPISEEEAQVVIQRTRDNIVQSWNYPGQNIQIEKNVDTTSCILKNILDEMDRDEL